MRSRLLLIPSLIVCLVLVGCGGAPPTPKAEQYFADAKNNLASLDFETALKNLDRTIKAAGDQPLAQQGNVLRVALLTAMAEGSKQMAETYGAGAKEPAAQPRQAQFTKMRADYYGIARVRLMNAMEGVMGQRGKLAGPALPLEVAFPNFSGTEHAALTRVKHGQWPEDADRYRAELEMIRNALARTLARLVGVGEDLNKGRASFEKGAVQIDPRTYLLELSNTFLKLNEIFDRRALDDARYRRITLEVVRDNLDITLKLLEAKPDKELQARVKKLKAECEKKLKELGD